MSEMAKISANFPTGNVPNLSHRRMDGWMDPKGRRQKEEE